MIEIFIIMIDNLEVQFRKILGGSQWVPTQEAVSPAPCDFHL